MKDIGKEFENIKEMLSQIADWQIEISHKLDLISNIENKPNKEGRKNDRQ